jgi:uncharacterized protein
MQRSLEDCSKFSNLTAPILISLENLSKEALFGIIESFILREGTDYGLHEMSYDKKFEQILKKIQQKEFLITFDPATESVTIMTQLQWRDLMKGKEYEL